jgi:tyrosine-protein phosphatase YwqE
MIPITTLKKENMQNLFSRFFPFPVSEKVPIPRVDMHAHLLPGIDDGAKDMEDSLRLIRGMQNLGYQKLITTPHVYQEFYPNTHKDIQIALAEVRKALAEAEIDIEIEAAAEYFMDEHFDELLEADDLLTFGDNQVLVEISFFAEPPGLEETFFKLRTKGYRPILAHPERYMYLAREPERFTRFREMGVQLQLNALSLSGHYGPEVKKLARLLLQEGQYSFIGSDLHHQAHLEKLPRAFKVKELIGYRFQNNSLLDTVKEETL